MNFLRPLGALIIILILAFIFRDQLPNLASSVKNYSSEIVGGSFSSSTLSFGNKLENNLPPPLQSINPATPDNSSSLSFSSIITLTNKERKDNGNLAPLSENSKLDSEAKAKAEDMFDNQYFEHVSPTGRGPAELAKTSGYEYVMIGENLALGDFKDTQALLDAWMNSPGHRANILNSKFSELGATVEEGTYKGEKVWIAVQEFGEPVSACPSPEASLQASIETLKADLDVKESFLQNQKSDIDSTYPKSGAVYNQKVAAYNGAVVSYNAEVSQTKQAINVYNGEVNAFNSCISAS